MEESYIGIEVLKVMENARLYNKALVNLVSKNFKKGQKILDFGAGIGTLSEIFRLKGFEVDCIENNFEETNILKSKGFKVFSDINEFPDESIDNIVAYNVFEHILEDEEVLKQIYPKVKKDGKLLIFVPAFQSLYSNFDKNLGHVRRYEQNDFLSLIQNVGFKIKEWRYFDSLGYLSALSYRKVSNNGNVTKKQVLIYDKIIFPLSMAFDLFFNKFFGKNIYAIAIK